MTRGNELEKLASGLQSAPEAAPLARQSALDAALRSFDQAHQENVLATRLNPGRHMGAVVSEGWKKMVQSLTSRPALALTTTGLTTALAFVAVFPNIPFDSMTRDRAALPKATMPAPSPEISALSDNAFAFPNALQRATPAEEGTSEAKTVLSIARPEPQMLMPKEEARAPDPSDNSEAFSNAKEASVLTTAEHPVSTFSIETDTASYSVIRNSLLHGALPDPDAVRIEEMLNYFPYDYQAPDLDRPFQASFSVQTTPWNAETRLVRIGLQGRMPAIEERPPLNLVLLIDTSGSMDDPAKLPLLKQSLALMIGQLRPEDQIAVVAYAGSAGLVLPPTQAFDRDAILDAMRRLDAGGATGGEEGLQLAYATARSMAGQDEVSRVLLATDGDFNLGISDPDRLASFISDRRKDGIYLSVLGFGRGNLDDATMQALAQNGNGTASYIDTLQEARKVLVDQLTGTLFPIADDVKVQVEWNPAAVAEYRLIGYETRALEREDFNNDRVDAGEIGAGHQVTALYEITAPGSPGMLNDPLRYATNGGVSNTGPDETELGFLRLRYKMPGEEQSRLMEMPILPGAEADDEARFAVAIAGFGQLLRHSVYLKAWSWEDAIDLALQARGEDPFGYRAEAVTLLRLARDLSK